MMEAMFEAITRLALNLADQSQFGSRVQ